MIFYRLNDEQAQAATRAIILAVPAVASIVFFMANEGRSAVAMSFGAMMAASLSLIAVQIMQSRRLNAAERDTTLG